MGIHCEGSGQCITWPGLLLECTDIRCWYPEATPGLQRIPRTEGTKEPGDPVPGESPSGNKTVFSSLITLAISNERHGLLGKCKVCSTLLQVAVAYGCG